jgi:hypothetical protein
MTTQDADSDGPSGLKDSPEPPQATEPELDAYGLPVQKRAQTGRTAYCLALASLIRAVVAVGLVIAEIITHRKPASSLFFLGWLPGFAAAFLARC